MKEISEYTLKECLEEVEMLHGGYGFRDPEKLAYRIHDLTRWIPVSERMPDKEELVLVWAKGYDGQYHAIEDWWCEISEAPLGFSSATIVVGEGWHENEFENVTHWKRITPPEGKP
jgi:hypothetical protein